MRTDFVLAVFHAIFVSIALSGNFRLSSNVSKIIVPRTYIADCGQRQEEVLTALLAVISQWADFALSALPGRSAPQEDTSLALEVFGRGAATHRSATRRQIRERFRALAREAESRRLHNQIQNTRFVCSNCDDAEDRTGYNLFAINIPRPRFYITHEDSIKIVWMPFSSYQNSFVHSVRFAYEWNGFDNWQCTSFFMEGFQGYPTDIDDRWNRISILIDRLVRTPSVFQLNSPRDFPPPDDNSEDPTLEAHNYVLFAKGDFSQS